MLVKRENRTKSNDLIVVYRPCTVDELLGNDTSRKVIKNNLDNNKVSHTTLLSGPSGCGKTTVARIMALGLNCEKADGPTSTPCMECNSCVSILNQTSLDVMEINVGKDRGKGDIEKVVRDLSSNPFSSRCKVIIFDEAHNLTSAAKSLLLKETEDGYAHVYFIFCTNHPEELSAKDKKSGGDPFLGRCSKIEFRPLSEEELKDMLVNVLQFEGEDYDEKVLDYITEVSNSVPRDALMLLNDVINEGSWGMEVVTGLAGQMLEYEDPQIMKLGATLMKGKWRESRDLYSKLVIKFPTESIRLAIAGCVTGRLKRAKKISECRKCSAVLDIMTVPIYAGGKAAEHSFYNYLFKSADIIQNSTNDMG